MHSIYKEWLSWKYCPYTILDFFFCRYHRYLFAERLKAISSTFGFSLMTKQNQRREAVIYMLSLGLLVAERTLKCTEMPSAVAMPAFTNSVELWRNFTQQRMFLLPLTQTIDLLSATSGWKARIQLPNTLITSKISGRIFKRMNEWRFELQKLYP